MFILSQSTIKKFTSLGTVHLTDDNKLYTSNGNAILIASPVPRLPAGEYELEQPSFFRPPSSLEFYQRLERKIKDDPHNGAAYVPLPIFKQLYKAIKLISSGTKMKSVMISIFCEYGGDPGYYHIGVNCEGFTSDHETLPDMRISYPVYGPISSTFETSVFLTELEIAMEPINGISLKNEKNHFVKITFCGDEQPISLSWGEGHFHVQTIFQYMKKGRDGEVEVTFDEDLIQDEPLQLNESQTDELSRQLKAHMEAKQNIISMPNFKNNKQDE